MRSLSINRPGRAAPVSHFTPVFLGFGVLRVLLPEIFGRLQQQAQTRDEIQKSMVVR